MVPSIRRAALVALGLVGVLVPGRTHAIDKQGSAHGGQIAGAESGFAWSGSVSAGVSLYNPTYAARPDNTGLVLFRYAAHADLDLIGRRLSIPIDINTFTDRERDGLRKLTPSELDVIVGLTSTNALGPGALEVGARVEQDRAVDRSGVPAQTYADARARYLAAFGALHFSATLGWFVINRTYFARPDNTGLALFRYAVHPELALSETFAVGADATMFTDRHANWVLPSELDLSPELIVRRGDFEAHLAYERDMPIDGQGSGFVQQFVYLLFAWSFSGG